MVRRIVNHQRLLRHHNARSRLVSARQRVYIPVAVISGGARPRSSKRVRNMGLEDFTSSTTEESSSISTRKKLKNVNFERDFYDTMIASDPQTLSAAAAYTDESSIKAIVQRMDEVMEDGVDGWNISDQQYDKIEEEREHIVEEYL